MAGRLSELSVRHRERHDAAEEPVRVEVVLPHLHEVLRADDERLEALSSWRSRADGGRDERLAESDDVADHHAPPAFEHLACDPDGVRLVLEQNARQRLWDVVVA